MNLNKQFKQSISLLKFNFQLQYQIITKERFRDIDKNKLRKFLFPIINIFKHAFWR